MGYRTPDHFASATYVGVPDRYFKDCDSWKDN
jgi:hypothetical protein